MKFRLTKQLKEKVKRHAIGSFYRLNAKTADCYAMTLIGNGDWEGGWDWSDNLVDRTANYLYMFESDTFVKLP